MHFAHAQSSNVLLDETGPFAVYGPYADHPDLGESEPVTIELQDGALDNVMAILPPLLQRVLIRPQDVGKFVFGLWARECYGEYYLTPDAMSLRTHGVPDQEWMHQAFTIFDTAAHAKHEGERRFAADDWYAYSVSQITRTLDGIELVRIHSACLRAEINAASF